MTALAPTAALGARSEIAGALDGARRHLIELQHSGGWWKAELETNVTMDAEDLMLRHFLGILDPDVAEAAAGWIRSNQRPDGTWGTYYRAPPDLSTTVEAYVALRLAGDGQDAPHMVRAAGWVRAHGGIEHSRVFTRIWLATLGRWSWEDLPVLPPEIMFLPPWAPLNIYDFGCWARQTVVALTVVMAYRPARSLPFDIDELRADQLRADQPGLRPTTGLHRRPGAPGSVKLFAAIDRVLHRYERLPSWAAPRRVLRRAALARAERWICQRQEADGLWGGIQPPVVYSIIALALLGYGLDHPVMSAALAGLDAFVIHDEKGRRVEACQSPVWDTALAVVALSDAGAAPDDPAVSAASDWLLTQEIRVTGDWAVRRPRLEPGGWAFEFANEHYPDIDDTAEVVMALRRAGGTRRSTSDAACRRGVAWTLGMQGRDGGWGAFDVDNRSKLVASLPFCDFGEVTDPPSADVTAHVLEMLTTEPGVRQQTIDQAVDWLTDRQEPDGSWFGRWGVNHLYGTGAVVPALIAAGIGCHDVRIRHAVSWLADHQNPDGGWGEDPRSYSDDEWRGRGSSTASQTAWALIALLAAGERDSPVTRGGIEWLVATQTDAGTWEEPWFTGTGFPGDFTINYHLYRLVWPMMALGRYLRAVDRG